jgi:hypothetical protein
MTSISMQGITEKRMQHFLKTAGAALMATGLFFGSATAAPLPNDTSIKGAATAESPVELAQFLFGGRNYCFYPDGWHGPGFYWCGYAFRTGFGYGGPEGWRGWGRGGPGRGGPRGGFRGGPRGGAVHGGPKGGGAHHH